MSYGRSPHYIYRHGSEDGEAFYMDGADVPYDVMAQFIASLANRGDEEISQLVERGKVLRPEIRRTLRVIVTGDGWGEPEFETRNTAEVAETTTVRTKAVLPPLPTFEEATPEGVADVVRNNAKAYSDDR